MFQSQLSQVPTDFIVFKQFLPKPKFTLFPWHRQSTLRACTFTRTPLFLRRKTRTSLNSSVLLNTIHLNFDAIYAHRDGHCHVWAFLRLIAPPKILPWREDLPIASNQNNWFFRNASNKNLAKKNYLLQLNVVEQVGEAMSCLVCARCLGFPSGKTKSKSRSQRSEERRVGKECSDECRSRWSPYH